MKKVSLHDFCSEILRSIEDFEMDENIQKFSNRSEGEWFKILGDYLGLSSKKNFVVNENDDLEDDA